MIPNSILFQARSDSNPFSIHTLPPNAYPIFIIIVPSAFSIAQINACILVFFRSHFVMSVGRAGSPAKSIGGGLLRRTAATAARLRLVEEQAGNIHLLNTSHEGRRRLLELVQGLQVRM